MHRLQDRGLHVAVASRSSFNRRIYSSAVLGFDFDYGAGNAAETSSAKSPLSWSNVRRDGTRVTIIERGEQLLRREDSDVAEEVYKILREDGIDMGL